FVTFNCKNVKRSVDNIRDLCNTYELQEIWLTSDEIPFLNTISDDFSSTGVSAMDTSAGLLRGRPYGGVALLWRRSVFVNVVVIGDNPRICAIKVVSDERSFLVICVYMPTDEKSNLAEFTDVLSSVSAIIDSCSVDCVYIMGDFNAHPHEQFYYELQNFCSEQEWSCIDFDMLDIVQALKEASIIGNDKKKSKRKVVAGWNKHVAEAHGKSRLKFQSWELQGKPATGKCYDEMCEARKIFRSRLKWRQDHETQIKLDILATHHSKNDFSSFWKHTKRLQCRPGRPVSVDGVSEPAGIANMFVDRFKVNSPSGPRNQL
ncbi:LOW QUALITY PROTEIN: uncharacterized protein ACR2FA_003318, partial [Aphomia sociella]